MDKLNLTTAQNILAQIYTEFDTIYDNNHFLAFPYNQGKVQIVKRDCCNLEHINKLLNHIFSATSAEIMTYELTPSENNVDMLTFDCRLSFLNFKDRHKSMKKSNPINLTITDESVTKIYDKYHLSKVA